MSEKRPLDDLHAKDKSVLAWKQPRKSTKKKVLFICVANSVRSQMAEGWLRHLYGDRYEAYSAGSRQCTLDPLAVQVMKEAGVDISCQRSKVIEEMLDDYYDVIVTCCDSAREQCPIYPGATEIEHQSFPAPSDGGGTQDEIVERYREVRDMIRAYVERRFGEGR
ncbi:MAG: arsenate reductase ArsC [Methanomassiliicoccales archaeon]|nr:arsenate reductase ArsC [Methanomassiliicoccales archaeon]